MSCQDIETRLNDYVDGTLSAVGRGEVNEHLAACVACKAAEAALRALLAEAGRLPRDDRPSRDLWPAIRSAIEPRPAVSPRRPAATGHARGRWAGLAVAAVLLAAMISVALIGDGGERMPERTAGSVPAPDGAAPTPVLSAVLLAEAEYARAADELVPLYDRARGNLAPETVAAVDANLSLIDDAIAEARGALDRDPANPRLGLLAAAMYERKVEVLRRTTRLSLKG